MTTKPAIRLIVAAFAATGLTVAAEDIARNAAEPAAEAEFAADDTPDEIDAAYARFLRLREEERMEEAQAAALQVATLTQNRYGLEAMEMVTPLVNLAVMQSLAGDLAAAEQNYKSAIGIIERNENMFSPRLINPLTGLGHAYNRAGLYERAIESFERALRLNNIELGFTNFAQFGIQDGLTESYVGLREYEDATFYQEAQVEIHQRKFGSENTSVVPALYKLAEWYSRIGNLEMSALTYRSADRILRENESETSSNRADALLGLARLYERQGNQPAAANTLRRGLKIIESNPEPDRLIRARVRVALGDLYMRQNKRNAALEEYRLAWIDLSSSDELEEQRDFFFEMPVRIAGGPFPEITRAGRGAAPDARADGYVVVRYTIDADGRVRSIAIVESEPAELFDDTITSIYRRSRYRPRMADGEPVATTDLLMQHDFKFAAKGSRESQASPSRSDRKGGRIDYPGAPAQ